MCGLCKVFHGKDAETAYKEYIDGTRAFLKFLHIIRIEKD